jgi:hypothetical protein
VAIVPCDEPHQYEVYRTFQHPGATASYPSPATLENLKDECRDAANEYVGAPIGDLDLEIYMFIPLEEQWEAGDRMITCTLRRPGGDGSMTGTQEGQGE